MLTAHSFETIAAVFVLGLRQNRIRRVSRTFLQFCLFRVNRKHTQTKAILSVQVNQALFQKNVNAAVYMFAYQGHNKHTTESKEPKKIFYFLVDNRPEHAIH